MKKLIAIITASIISLNYTITATAEEADEFIIPKTNAYVLIEATTNTMLYAYNENERLPISSLSKIMSLLIIAEELQAGRVTPTDQVPISGNVSGIKGSIIWLMPGEVMTLGELAKAVVISSSNDAMLALAEYIAGSAEEFTALMNRKATELGMENTFFADCGVLNENQDSYSSARDVAIMTAELFKYDVYGKFFTMRLSAVREGQESEAQLLNTNKMAHWYKGLLGGKAAQSEQAGFCVANCAIRDGMSLVAVVLGANDEDDRVNLCEHLLDEGFKRFELITPRPEAEKFSPLTVLRGVKREVEVVPAGSTSFVAARGDGQNAEYEYVMPENITAPVEKGQEIGRFSVKLHGEVVCETELIALEAIEELDFWKSFEVVVKGLLRL